MRCSPLIVTVAFVTVAFAATFAAGGAEAKLDLYVDKSTQKISVVQDGYLIHVWPVSTGRDRFSTPNGVYTPERLERSWFSKAYYNAPMPHAIFFHNGYAIHGSYDIAQLGGPASHGCVRLHPQNAAALFAMVAQEGPGNTAIMIGGDSAPNAQAPRYRDTDDRFMDDRFTAAPPHEGATARGGYPPDVRMAPGYGDPYGEPAGRRPGGDGQFAMRAPYPEYRPSARPRDTDAAIDPRIGPRGEYGQFPMRDGYQMNRPPGPRRDAGMPPEPRIGPRGEYGQFPMRDGYQMNRPPAVRRDAEAPIEPRIGPRQEGGQIPMQVPMRGAYPGNRPAPPRRDARTTVEPPRSPRGDNGQLATVRTPPAARPPAPRRDAEAAPPAPAAAPGGGNRILATDKSKCPGCASNRDPDPAASNRATPGEPAKAPSPPDQPQSTTGYKVLPKSYWAGASWRWRFKSEHENK